MSAATTPTVPLDHIPACFEGIIPSSICSCAKDGMPNTTFLSIVHRIDDHHVGLSFQFFNKTARNVRENPFVQVIVISPETAEQFRLDLRYERTDSAGPSFDRMKARLDAIASQTGMSHIFHLRGLDIYQVLDCRPVNSDFRGESGRKTGDLAQLDIFTERLAACADLDGLVSTALRELSELFGYDHAFVMVPDENNLGLYTIAAHGFDNSGVGSEAIIGKGILGTAAERRSPVRVTTLAREFAYSRAVRDRVPRRHEDSAVENEIALPGLADVRSILALPLVAFDELLGVLCLQSANPGRFMEADERLMQIVARHLAASMCILRFAAATTKEERPKEQAPAQSVAATSVIKHYKTDDSVFIDDAYLIKGVAGRILWKLLQVHVDTGRTLFTNREIRLDPKLRLPDVKDNLEARLILLRRRLENRCPFLRLMSSGRGQFYVEVSHRLTLEECT